MINYGKFVKPPAGFWRGTQGTTIAILFFLCFALFARADNSANIAVNEITEPSGIVINEILPSPEGPDDKEEWVEVFNQNDFEVDLSLWKIADTVGKTTTYTFPKGTKIPPKGFLLLDRPKTKITLNNSGDGLNLIQPDGKIIDLVVYEGSPRGQSYNRIDSKWFWSQTLTPTEVNIIPPRISKAKSVESSKEKEITPEKGLAAVGEIRDFSKFLPFLIALIIAIFSGAIILIMKKRLEG